MNSSAAIKLQHFGLNYCQQPLLGPLNLSLPKGHWCCILGPSGVGKSSLLRAIAGLLPTADYVKQGRIHFAPWLEPNPTAFMAQEDSLFPWLRVIDNVLIGPRLRGSQITTMLHQQACDLLQQVGLEQVEHHFPQQLSGGMRQRVALARTLMENKPLVLMDEPFSSVDAITRLGLYECVARTLHTKTVLWVTHDPLEALRLSHSIFVLKGQPATLQTVHQTDTQVLPRKLTEHDFLHHYPRLCAALCTDAKEISC